LPTCASAIAIGKAAEHRFVVVKRLRNILLLRYLGIRVTGYAFISRVVRD
jgi:hypothetical protein